MLSVAATRLPEHCGSRTLRKGLGLPYQLPCFVVAEVCRSQETLPCGVSQYCVATMRALPYRMVPAPVTSVGFADERFRMKLDCQRSIRRATQPELLPKNS